MIGYRPRMGTNHAALSLGCHRAMQATLRWLLLCLLGTTLPQAALAQQVSNQYTNATSGAINDLTCGTGNVVTRTFSVGPNLLISDVNIGVALRHTYRSDLRIILTAPSGTSVTLMDATAGDGDNLSDLFDDSASTSITSHSISTNDSTAAVPPYSHSFRPQNSLSAFNGQTSSGTWTLTICDQFAADVGTFTRSDLYITGSTFADLSLGMTASSTSPVYGTNLTYTLTAISTSVSSGTATGVTVGAALPSGLTFVSAAGSGSFNSSTGVWSVGSLAPGGNASMVITARASGAVGSTVVYPAQITASSQPDPDSVVNNGATGEDDYSSRSITIAANTINCPQGSTATGSGFSSSGTSTRLGQIFWLDWSCGSTAFFNAGATVNKTWVTGDGITITGQLTGITAEIQPYTVGSWPGDILQTLHAGLNPIGLFNRNPGEDPQFNLSLSASLNGSPNVMRWVIGDAEDSGGPATAESIQATTNGSSWQMVESAGSVTVDNSGSTITIYDPANAGGGTAVLETSALNLSLNVGMMAGGNTAAAFGFYAPYDFSDAPLTGTSYGAAYHRTLPGLRIGPAVTSETTAYDSSTASADADDGVTIGSLFRGQPASIDVAVTGSGRLSAWIDWNDDGDFADSGETVASNVQDGGSGDADGVVNGTIRLAVTPPAGAATTPTIARFRWSSQSGSSASGLFAYGEVEDYSLTVIYPNLTVAKSSTVLSDPVNGTLFPKAVPGATLRYCLLVTNSGSAPASSITLVDTLPGNLAYQAGTMRSGISCATAATVEDDDATGSDETDGFGSSVSGATISAEVPSIAVDASAALVYDVKVN